MARGAGKTVLVHFPIQFSHGALLRLVDAHKTVLPMGSTAHLTQPAIGSEISIGYDGEAFVTGLGPRNTLRVTLPNGGHCIATFPYHGIASALPEIGPIPCLETPS